LNVNEINWHTFFFLLFGLVACAASVAVVVTGNIVRMAFYLIIALGTTAGLFFLAGASFVGAMQLMIYVGGTLVLLIFGVMLTAQGPFVSMKTRRGEWVLALLVGGSLLAVLLYAAFSIENWRRDPKFGRATAITGSPTRPHAQVVIRAKQSGEQLGLPVKFIEVESADELKGAREDSVVSVKFKHDALTISFVKNKATASDIVEDAIKESRSDETFAKTFEASLPVGSRGDGIVTVDDGVLMAIRAPRGDTPPGKIGLAFLGFGGAGTGFGKSGYLLPFEIISVHLLVVLIGAAYLARTKKRASAPVEKSASPPSTG